MASQYVSKDLQATTHVQSVEVNTELLLLLINDSSTGNLFVSFEQDKTDDYVTLKPGEKYTNLDIQICRLYFKCSEGTVNFRFFGLNK